MVLETVLNKPRTPPGGTIKFPSNCSTPTTDGVGVAAETVVVSNALAVGNSGAQKNARLFVRPVIKLAVDSENALTADPVDASVLRLKGFRDAVRVALLPTEAARIYAPGATLVTLFIAATNVQDIITTLTPEVDGFQTPTMGWPDAVSKIVAADSAVKLQPME